VTTESNNNTHQKTGGEIKDKINLHQTERITGGLLATTTTNSKYENRPIRP
jgi:transposase